ncbi:MAG: hypothetical protein ABIN36_10650 [Ferruginibacter sp.]
MEAADEFADFCQAIPTTTAEFEQANTDKNLNWSSTPIIKSKRKIKSY